MELRQTINGQVAAYLLAEFRCYAALPLMAQVFENPAERSPVSRLFVFYAMHTLALEHPRDGLSAKAITALDEYLAATRKQVPEPVEVSVPAWDAPIDETDFRITVLGQPLPLDQVPQVRLRKYPASFGKFEPIGQMLNRQDHGIAREVYGWHGKLKRFITLAYPGQVDK